MVHFYQFGLSQTDPGVNGQQPESYKLRLDIRLRNGSACAVVWLYVFREFAFTLLIHTAFVFCHFPALYVYITLQKVNFNDTYTLTHKKEHPCIVFPADLNPKRLILYTSSKQLLAIFYFVWYRVSHGMCVQLINIQALVLGSVWIYAVFWFCFSKDSPSLKHRDEVESTVGNGRRARMLLEMLWFSPVNSN